MFDFQHPDGHLQQSIIPVPGDVVHSSGPTSGIHACKTPIYRKGIFKKRKTILEVYIKQFFRKSENIAFKLTISHLPIHFILCKDHI